MGRRVGQIAGLLAFALALGRLGRILISGPGHPRWNLTLVAAAVLGGLAWWVLAQAVSRTWIRFAAFTFAGLLLTMRIAAPETLIVGFLPTPETVSAMWDEMAVAFRIIQSGVPPVAVTPGLLAVLAALMWLAGGSFAWGSIGGPYPALFLPPLVLYFQFAVLDRTDAGLGWLLVSATALALTMVSLAMERRIDAGRARDAEGRPMGRRAMHLAAIMAGFLAVGSLLVADNASAVVSEYGNAPWRGSGSSGYGDGVGGIRYDRLVDLRQQIVSRSERPVFEATLGPGAPPAGDIYWRVETLDTFDGESWDRSDRGFTQYEPGRPLANEYDAYQGPTFDFAQVVRIEALRSDVAPTAGVPVEISEVPGDGSGRRTPTDFQVLSDSAIVATPPLQEGDTYQVRTLLADRFEALGALATGPDGELSPMFAAAAAAGDFPYQPEDRFDSPTPPPNLDSYLTLPENTPTNIRTLSRALTLDASSDFERVWLLQAWFRDSGEFTYSTDVTTGHSALILDEWLTDRSSENFRTGYCEQFAAALAVMVRTLDIPSRVVWGFTPGDIETQADGTQKVVVRDRNAHAWVEVWLEPFGWVSFDPTPRGEQTDYAQQPASITAGFDPQEYLPDTPAGDPVTQPSEPSVIGDDPLFTDEGISTPDASEVRWWLVVLAALIPLIAAVPMYKRLRRRRRLQRLSEGDIAAAWDEMVDRLTDLRYPVEASLTPMELARSTDPALVPLAVSYSASLYGAKPVADPDSDLYAVEWWIDRAFDGRSRARAALSLRSLLPRK